MMELSEHERNLIAEYLLERGKQKIKEASVRSVDFYARFFTEELGNLDRADLAKDLYAFYQETWG